MFRFLLNFIIVLIVLSARSAIAQPTTSTNIYSNVEESVFQVQVVNKQTGKKSTIGSGFVVQDPRILVTNYHVVSLYVNNPNSYNLDYLSTTGKTGHIELLAVDVIHDLAILKADSALSAPLSIAAEQPPKGADLFSLGNPLDLGFSIVEGINNGMLKYSDDNNILFSGSLNSGMSGGPTLNENGEVIGINVATSGNEISFLVPVQYLTIILDRLKLSNYAPDTDIKERITDQLKTYSTAYMARLLEKNWTSLKIGNFNVVGDIESATRCWDQSEKADGKNLLQMFYTVCANDNNIYLDENVEVGKLSYDYMWLDAEQLVPARFYRRYEALNSMSSDSEADKNDVTNFQCFTDFTTVGGQEFKMTVCRRDYINYTGLSDLIISGAMVGYKQKGMLFNLSMSGVDFDVGMKFLKRVLEGVKWQP